MGFLLGQPFAEMTVGRFGGLYTEADERDLPLGASPLNHDVDFLIGGVGIRPGLTTAFTGDALQSIAYIKSTHLIPPFSPAQNVVLYEQVTEGSLAQIGGNSIAPDSNFAGSRPVINGAIATSENFENVEFIALSNLQPEVVALNGKTTSGYDQPRTWNGSKVGRVSQAGPSAPITVASEGTGSGLAAGPRYAIAMFLMFDGSITPASPPALFTTTGSELGLTFSNLQTGPVNVVGRIVAITLANAGIGGPYFYIPNPVGADGPTVINDNTSTTLTATLSDVVISAGVNLSQVGGNILQMREIGEYVKATQYAGRMFYLGERVKLDDIPGMTFDGGSITGAYPWTLTHPNSSMTVVQSVIYGQALSIHNTTGVAINASVGTATDYISRSLGYDAFGIPIIKGNIDYSIRVTAYTNLPGQGCEIAVVVDGATDGITQGLSLTPSEYIFTMPGIGLGSTLQLIPLNLPGNSTCFIDRVEIFPTNNPIYQSQLSVSYLSGNGVLGDPQSVDSITGAVDASLFTTDPLTDEFVFLNSLYFATAGRLFQTQVSAGSEPAGWTVTEISQASGVCGPLADDAGEAWAVYANRQGVYIFDGGTPQKISQEIQQLWNEVYFPSINRVWVKIDLYQQRVLVGVPMVTPNKWMPDAPANASPATPNVILCMSYLGLTTASDIAAASGVHPSQFTGQLLARDQVRKWTAWTIASPIANWVNLTAVAQQLWLGGTGTGKIYALDGSNQTDDGVAIPEKYTTFGFSDEMQDQAMQLGSVRKQYAYMTAKLEGTGGAILTTFPETLETPYADSQPAVTLANPALDDVNLPVNETGNCCFFQFKTDGNPGSYFNLRRLVVGVTRDPSIPISGT